MEKGLQQAPQHLITSDLDFLPMAFAKVPKSCCRRSSDLTKKFPAIRSQCVSAALQPSIWSVVLNCLTYPEFALSVVVRACACFRFVFQQNKDKLVVWVQFPIASLRACWDFPDRTHSTVTATKGFTLFLASRRNLGETFNFTIKENDKMPHTEKG